MTYPPRSERRAPRHRGRPNQQHRPNGQTDRFGNTPAFVDTPNAPIDSAIEHFGDIELPRGVVQALAGLGATEPFAIQTATLPDSMAGRDVLGRGRTGSGKTLAFAIPTVMALHRSSRQRMPLRPRALVLVPTRELANQVAAAFRPLATALNMRVTTVFGGAGQGPQVNAMRAGVDIVVACPGRLEDLIQQGHCQLDRVEVTVLDEADHMADLGFLPGVKRILDRTPSGTQRLLFSATLDNGVDVLVKRYLQNPIVHSVEPEVTEEATMVHHVLTTSMANKPSLIEALAGGQARSLLFTRTKHGAKKVAKQLSMRGIPAVELHGNLSQSARERNLSLFSSGEVLVLVATDIAARGIHVDEIGLVVHVDPPAEHKAYLHRSGRTARAGASGTVVTLMTPEQKNDVRSLMRSAKIDPTITSVEPGHPMIGQLTGPSAPRQKVRAEAMEASYERPERGPRPGGPRQDRGRSNGAAPSAPRGARTGQPGARSGGQPGSRPGQGGRGRRVASGR